MSNCPLRHSPALALGREEGVHLDLAEAKVAHLDRPVAVHQQVGAAGSSGGTSVALPHSLDPTYSHAAYRL